MSDNNCFKLTMAEFKGKVLQSLDDIKGESKLNREQHTLFFDRIRKLELRPSFSTNPIGWITYALGFHK